MEQSELLLKFIGINMISDIAAGIGRDVERLAQKIEGHSNGMMASWAKIGAGMMMLGGTLLAADAIFAAPFVASIKAAASFDSEMVLIETQALATKGEIAKMRQPVLDLAAAFGQNANDVAKAAYMIESAGFRYDSANNTIKSTSTSVSILTAAVKGATIGNSDLETTARALSAVMLANLHDVHNETDAMAMLDAIVGSGTMRMEELVAAMRSGIIPAAQQFGLGLHDVGGALAVMTDLGVPAVQAATRLRMALTLMGAPTRQAAKELKAIGMADNEVTAATEDMEQKLVAAGLTHAQLATDMREHGLEFALQHLSSAMQKAGFDADTTSNFIARAFGGGRLGTAITTQLFNMQQLDAKTKLITASTGTFNERLKETLRERPDVWFKILNSEVQTTEISIGEALLPVVWDITQAIIPLVEQLRHWIAGHEKLLTWLIPLIIGGVALVGVLLMVAGAAMILVPFFATMLIPAIMGIGAVIIPLLAFLALLVVGFILVRAFLEPVKKAFQENQLHFERLSGIFQRDIPKIIAWFEHFVGFLTKTFGPLVTQVVSYVLTLIQHWVNFFAEKMPQIERIVGKAVKAIEAFWKAHGAQIMETITTIWNAIEVIIDAATAIIQGVITIFLDLLDGNWKQVWLDIGNMVDMVWRNLLRIDWLQVAVVIIKALAGLIIFFLKTLPEAILKGAFGLILTGLAMLAGKMQEWGNQMKANLGKTWGAFKDMVAAVWKHIVTAVTGKLTEMRNAVVGKFNQIVGDVTRWATSIKNKIEAMWKAFQERPMYYVGKLIGYLLAVPVILVALYLGLQKLLGDIIIAFGKWEIETTRHVLSWVASTLAKFAGFMSTLLPRFLDWLNNMLVGIVKWVKDSAAKFAAWVADVVHAAEDFAARLPGRIAKAFTDTYNFLANWFPSTAVWLFHQAQNLATNIENGIKTFVQKMPGIAADAMRGLINGLWNMKDWAIKQVKQLGAGILQGFKEALGIASPSKLFAEQVGVPIMQGIGAGILGSMGAVKDAVGKATTSLAISPTSPASGGRTVMEDIRDGILKMVDLMIQEQNQTAGSVGDKSGPGQRSSSAGQTGVSAALYQLIKDIEYDRSRGVKSY